MALQASQIKKMINRYFKALAVWAVAVREPQALRTVSSTLKGRTYKLAIQVLLKLAQFILGRAMGSYKKPFFEGSAEARKLFHRQLLDGRADWNDLHRNLHPSAPKFVRLLVKHGRLLERKLANPKSALEEVRIVTRVLYEALNKLTKVKSSIKPKSVLPLLYEVLDLFHSPELSLRDVVEDTPKNLTKKLIADLNLEVPAPVLNAFRKAAQGNKVGRIDLRDVIDDEGVLVLTLDPEDIKFNPKYVVFYHPSFRLRAFLKMNPQKAAKVAERMVSTTLNLHRLLADLRKDYKNLYGAALRTRWVMVPVDDDRLKELPILSTHKQSAVEIIDRLTRELKEAHGEVARVKSLLQRGETIYLEKEDGEYEKATVTKINSDGSVTVRIGRKSKTINPLEDHYLTEEEYRKLTGGEETLTEDEMKVLKKLGIKVRGRVWTG